MVTRTAELPKGGDTPATSEVAAIAWPEIVSLVRRQMRSFVGPGRDLEDLAQTALERIYRSASANRFDGRSEFATYTYRTCARVAMNHWRWYKRWLRSFERTTESTPEPISLAADGIELALERERMERLERALDRLGGPKRAVLTLCDLEELPASRVAEILGCPEPTVRSRLRQARLDLAGFLKHDERQSL
jgi:RNA polymerase sigma-70 factor (ECF subfamily)